MTQATGSDGAEALIGRVFDGRYRIERVLGRGGMGVVYVAEQLSMAKQVALKVLPRHLSEDPGQVQRFNHEALASSHLRHPHTIRVFDYGKSEDGHLYIAMELLEGQVLSRVIRRERGLPAERVVHIARQVVKSIGEAHQAGLVHRDLKPDNIFLCDFFGEKDYVKVLDFGIAKFTEGGGGTDQAHTATGFIAGTPLYIAPEQALGEPVAPRSDLYALGAILYECLVGAPPFRADTPIAIVMKQIHETPPPLRSVKPDLQVPPDLEALVFQLLRKRPADRPATAEEVGAALDAVATRMANQSGLRRFKSVTDADIEEVTVVTGSGVAIPALDDGFSDTPSRGTAMTPAPATAGVDGAGDASLTEVAALRRPLPGQRPPRLPTGPGGAAPAGVTTERPGTTVSPSSPYNAAPMLDPPRSSPWAIAAAIAALVVILVGGGTALWFAIGPGRDLDGAGGEALQAQLEAEPAAVAPEAVEEPAAVAAVAAADEPAAAEAPAEAAPEPAADEAAPEGAEAPEGAAAVEVTSDALVEVRTKPAGAEVLAGDEVLGRTPLSVTVPAGDTRELSLRLDGYEVASVTADAEHEEGGIEVSLDALPPPEPKERKPKPARAATARPAEEPKPAPKEPAPKPRKGKIEWQDF
ncbi:MAG: serine/threonine protein kinase [Deltaproteobacteria bacterium]|nr:serine/threonine protein kinase [Deltaproteobacteria bacterium]MCB9788771.1 serine/threonine protein kinase [Deltaproteobacteria bacterium]